MEQIIREHNNTEERKNRVPEKRGWREEEPAGEARQGEQCVGLQRSRRQRRGRRHPLTEEQLLHGAGRLSTMSTHPLTPQLLHAAHTPSGHTWAPADPVFHHEHNTGNRIQPSGCGSPRAMGRPHWSELCVYFTLMIVVRPAVYWGFMIPRNYTMYLDTDSIQTDNSLP